jgi:DNA modification methylase
MIITPPLQAQGESPLGSDSCSPLRVLSGDCREILKSLPDGSVQCCVTSPPYWGLRDYGHAAQIGHEETPFAFVEALTEVFSEVRRVLKDDGTLWLNLGDTYSAGCMTGKQGANGITGNRAQNTTPLPPRKTAGWRDKNLLGIPWRVAMSLQSEGWNLRQDIIWSKPNPMPESVTDRCTSAHEYIFLLSKSQRYYYDAEAIRTPSANRKSVWEQCVHAFDGAHFATFPPDLIKPCIMAGTKPGDVVLDPFGGSGTTGAVALELGRRAVLIELNEEYLPIIESRTNTTYGLPL